MILMTFKKEINIFCQSFPDQSQKSSFLLPFLGGALPSTDLGGFYPGCIERCDSF